jgi:hypothetical protein
VGVVPVVGGAEGLRDTTSLGRIAGFFFRGVVVAVKGRFSARGGIRGFSSDKTSDFLSWKLCSETAHLRDELVRGVYFFVFFFF